MSVAGQRKLNAVTDKMGGRIPLRVFFLDNSTKLFLITRETKAKHLVSMICEKLGLDGAEEQKYYGIFEAEDGVRINRCLQPEDDIAHLMKRWEAFPQAKFIFMIKLYMKSILGIEHRTLYHLRHQINDQALDSDELPLDYITSARVEDWVRIRLQFFQATYNVITGVYPVSEEQAISLAAMQFFAKFEAYDPEKHQPGFFGHRLVEFIPTRLLKKSSKRKDQWESDIFAAIACMPGCPESRDEGKLEYLRQVWTFKNWYGVQFFRASQVQFTNLPEDVLLGINEYGLGIYDPKGKSLGTRFHLIEIFRWGYRPNASFYFEIKKDGRTTSIEFDTPSGAQISELLTDYAMAFLKEREREAQIIKDGVPLEEEDSDDEEEEEVKEAVEDEVKEADEVKEVSDHLAAMQVTATDGPSAEETHQNVLEVTEEEEEGGEGDEDALGSVSKTPSDLPPPPPSSDALETKEEADSAFPDLSEHNSPDSPVYRAVVKLQAACRGYNLRMGWLREDAAVLLQCVFRGHITRKKVYAELEEADY
jgi:hypothetical protein